MNAAPEWHVGMGEVEGIAAHPSMQAKSTVQIERRLRTARQRLVLDKQLPASEDRDELIAADERLIAAYELALRWRNNP